MTARILIAEDDLDLAEALRRCLMLDGHEVQVTGNAVDCANMLETSVPDIVIIGPEILWGGTEGLLDWLIDEYPVAPPVVIILDSPQAIDFPQSLQMRIDHRLRRPHTWTELASLLEQLQQIIQASQNSAVVTA